MFVDDLIIVTCASRSAARACKVCLEIYRGLTRKMLNVNKSNIYFPSWINKKICKVIVEILDMNVGVFPFKYMG